MRARLCLLRIGRWRAAALFVCTVISMVGLKPDIIFAVPLVGQYENLKTKFCPMTRGVVEGVVIIRPSPYVKMAFPRNEIVEQAGRKQLASSIHNRPWAEKSARRCRTFLESKSFGHHAGKIFSREIHHHFLGRSRPAVFPNGAYMPSPDRTDGRSAVSTNTPWAARDIYGHLFNENESPLGCGQIFFGDVCRLNGGASRHSRFLRYLVSRDYSLMQPPSLPSQCAELKKRSADECESQSDGPIGYPPLLRRGLLYMASLLGGFFCAQAGIEQLDGKRRRLGAALIFFGCLGAVCGTGLFLATFAFSETWGWPL